MKIKKIIDYVNENNGITLNKNAHLIIFNSGYFVSLKKFELKTKKITVELIKMYLQKIKKERGLYFGIWKDKDYYYLDVSISIKNFETAEKIGKKERQIAIYDCKNQKSIYLTY